MKYDKADVAKVYSAYCVLTRATGAKASGRCDALLRLLKLATRGNDTDKALAVGRLAAGHKTGRGGDLPHFMQPGGRQRTPAHGGRPAQRVTTTVTNNVGRGHGAR